LIFDFWFLIFDFWFSSFEFWILLFDSLRSIEAFLKIKNLNKSLPFLENIVL
jgi:hypothetical protein